MRQTFVMVLCLFSIALSAQAASPAKKLEGVYKKHFKLGLVAGEGKEDTPYDAEDIIEVVTLDDHKIYFRMSLAFHNGHSCGIYGVAEWQGDNFLYREPAMGLAPGCQLTIQKKGNDIFVTDRRDPEAESTCQAHCGARGSLSEYTIPFSKRRKIKYLPRLLKSREYLEATKSAN